MAFFSGSWPGRSRVLIADVAGLTAAFSLQARRRYAHYAHAISRLEEFAAGVMAEVRTPERARSLNASPIQRKPGIALQDNVTAGSLQPDCVQVIVVLRLGLKGVCTDALARLAHARRATN